MPYVISWEASGVVKKFWGLTSATEFFRSVEEIGQHPNFSCIRYIINDLTGSSGIQLSERQINEYALIHQSFTGHATPIFIAFIGNIALSLQAVQQIGGLPGLNKYRMRIFQSMSDAREWISAGAFN